MMKKSIILLTGVLLASCSDQKLAESLAAVKDAGMPTENADGTTDIRALIERARWGDGQAYLKLADCYRDGIDVKKDFLGMLAMIEQAQTRGAIHDEKEYITQIPDTNDLKDLYYLLEKCDKPQGEEKDNAMAQLAANDSPDASAWLGFMCVQSGDSIRGLELITDASERGSSLGTLLNAFLYCRGNNRPDKAKLEQFAAKTPMVYKMLGQLSRRPDENGKVDEREVAYYYLKADEHALLSRWEARWLLDYHEDVGIPGLTDEDVERLQAFARYPDEIDEAIVDSTYVDSIQ